MSFAQGFSVGMQWKERAEAKEKEEKDRARRFKALVEYGDAAGLIPKDQSLTLSLDELEGRMQGYAARAEAQRSAEKEALQTREIEARLRNYDAQDEQRAGAERDVALFSRLLQNYDLSPGANASEEDRAYAGLPPAGGLPRLDAKQFLTQWGAGGGSVERGLAIAEKLKALQYDQEAEESPGPPQILPGPFPNTRIVTDARGKSTPQVVREEKTAEGYIEVPDPNDPVYGPKIKLPLSHAQKEYPHLLERLKTDGGKPQGKGKPTRAIAADFVKKLGRAKALEELRKAGYDPTGYAD